MNTKKTIEQLNKQIEELKQRENFLEEILESSQSISIIATDKDGNITYWNSGAENIFGWKAYEVHGKSVDIIYPGDEKIKNDMKSLRKIVYKNRNVNFELPEISKDGKEKIIKMNLTPRFDKGGNIIGILGIGQNVTEQKLAEKKLSNLETYSGCLELAIANYEQKTSAQIIKDLLQQNLILAKNISDSSMDTINNIQRQIALALYDLGIFEEALDLLFMIHNAMNDLKEPDMIKIAEIQSNIAMVLYDLNRIDEAKSFAKKALKLSQDNYSEDHYLVNMRKTNLALILQESGDLKKAELLTKEAYKSLKETLGNDHSDTKVAKENLEIIKKMKKQFQNQS